MEYKIGSFNVRNLSWNTDAERLDRIAEIIREFDIIALQEVLSAGKILAGGENGTTGQASAYEHSLKYRLGDNWDMCWLNPETKSKWYPYLGNDSRGEGYAFIWRTDKFTCPTNEYGKQVRPRIVHSYHTEKGELRLIRDPAYGRFQILGMNSEIRLISTHIVYSKPSNENLAKVIDYGESTMRKNEFKVIARDIYTSINDDRNDINSVSAYTIILGDYNMNLNSSPSVPDVVVVDKNKNFLGTSVEAAYDNSCYVIYTEQRDLSTINGSADAYANNYDHFSYNEKVKNNILVESPHRIAVVKKSGGFEKYKKMVSDHVPVMIRLDLNK